MGKFIVHPIDEIKGVYVIDVDRKGKYDYIANFFLVSKDGQKTGPFALSQREGKRVTIDDSGNETTLRNLVYGKSRAIQWLDRLFYLVDNKDQFSRPIC